MTDDERAMRELVDTWLAASQAGDLSKVLSLMSDDVIFMVPGKEPFGKEAFAAGWEAQRKFRMEAKSDIQEINVLDGWAYLRNHLTVTMTPLDGGKPTRRAGYTLTILRKPAIGFSSPAGTYVQRQERTPPPLPRRPPRETLGPAAARECEAAE